MGFFDRLANAWKIFVFSFQILGQDKSLFILPFVMILGSGIIFSFMFLGYFFVTEAPILWMILTLFVISLWGTFIAAAQSWMVHEVLQGKDTTVGSGVSRALHNAKDIFYYTVVMSIITLVSSYFRSKGRLGEALGGTMSYLAGIIGKLVIPAMIVTERSFGEAVAQLKQSVRAFPEIATYEIGIRPLTHLALFLVFIISFFVVSPFGLIAVGITLFILLIVVILLALYVNTTYYTVLYLTIIEKKRVSGLDVYRPH